METNRNDFDLDFKVNLGLVLYARFSDLQKLKEYLEDHPELNVIYQTIDKRRLWIKKEDD